MFRIVVEPKTCAVQFSDDGKGNDEESHLSWVVPAVFRPLHVINDPQHFKGDKPVDFAQLKCKTSFVEFV